MLALWKSHHWIWMAFQSRWAQRRFFLREKRRRFMFLLRKLFQAKAAWRKVWSHEWAEEAKGSKFIPKPPAYSLVLCAMACQPELRRHKGYLYLRLGGTLGDPLSWASCSLFGILLELTVGTVAGISPIDSDILGSRQAACSAWVLMCVSEMGTVVAVVIKFGLGSGGGISSWTPSLNPG